MFADIFPTHVIILHNLAKTICKAFASTMIVTRRIEARLYNSMPNVCYGLQQYKFARRLMNMLTNPFMTKRTLGTQENIKMPSLQLLANVTEPEDIIGYFKPPNLCLQSSPVISINYKEGFTVTQSKES